MTERGPGTATACVECGEEGSGGTWMCGSCGKKGRICWRCVDRNHTFCKPAPAQASGRDGNTLRDDLRTLRNFGRACKVVQVGTVPYCQTHQNDHALCPPAPAPQRQEEAQRPMVTRAFFDARVAELEAEIQDEEHSRELHASLNRRAAEALGKPPFGEGSSWHDIPEQITALRAALSASEAEHMRVLDDLLYKHTAAMQAAQKAIEAAEAQATTLREALRRLRSEAKGMLALERQGIVALVSITNVRCLENAIAEADVALLEPLPEGASQDKERGA